MINNFDIDFVVDNFQATNLKYYLDLLKESSSTALRQFRREVKRHKKNNKQHQAFSNVHNFSTHDAIISAVDHELLKRSSRYSLYKLLLRLRSRVVKLFTGLELKEHEYFGSLYSQPKYTRHYYLYMTHKEFLPLACRFLKENWSTIIIAFGTLLGGAAALITAI